MPLRKHTHPWRPLSHFWSLSCTNLQTLSRNLKNSPLLRWLKQWHEWHLKQNLLFCIWSKDLLYANEHSELMIDLRSRFSWRSLLLEGCLLTTSFIVLCATCFRMTPQRTHTHDYWLGWSSSVHWICVAGCSNRSFDCLSTMLPYRQDCFVLFFCFFTDVFLCWRIRLPGLICPSWFDTKLRDIYLHMTSQQFHGNRNWIPCVNLVRFWKAYFCVIMFLVQAPQFRIHILVVLKV